MTSNSVVILQQSLVSGCPGGLNGSTQHFLEVYSQESENLKFVVGVDLSAALRCSGDSGTDGTFSILS